MVLPNNFIFINNFITKLPQQKIAQVISVCLLVYITSVAAKITWLMIPNANQTISNSGVKNTKPKQNQSQTINLDISKLQALNLFGIYNEAIVEVDTSEVIQNVPETRLQLTLSGLVASDNPETSAAIIANKGQQATYGVGDIIKDTRASLEQVLIDRVIIKQSGRLETLMLDGADYNQAAQSVSTKKAQQSTSQTTSQSGPKNRPSQTKASVVDQRSNTRLSENAQRLRADIANDPGKITDYLRISPVRKDGAIAGYRLSPGKNPDFFNLSGLKSGDVATQMNGHDLLAPLEAAQAMSALKTERDISLLVERQGELIEILFSIN